MLPFNTVHVFGYGESQIIGTGANKKVASTSLPALAAFVDYVKTKKPAEVVLTDYHVIHVFNDMDVRYLGKPTGTKTDVTTFTIKWADLDLTTLTALVTELSA